MKARSLARSQRPQIRPSILDRIILSISPERGFRRLQARAAAQIFTRHYEAAAIGRRTSNWARSGSDANVAAGSALSTIRNISRDLARNNGWAVAGIRAITNNTVGWGITPNPPSALKRNDAFMIAWKRWAETTQCDADGRLNYYGLQRLALRTIVESGEVLIRRRARRTEDGLDLPLQLQVLEPDFLDTLKEADTSQAGGPIIQGVEFDKLGARAAYWLFSTHPGSSRLSLAASRRIPASEIIHSFEVYRPGQVRGAGWLAPIIVKLKDFSEFDDAMMMRQKIAACFAAFVTTPEGSTTAIAEQSTTDDLVETFEPGMIKYLREGQNIEMATPPLVGDQRIYMQVTLRQISAGLGTTYEDMTGDYSMVNFSSARMARLAFGGSVNNWQWNMMIPTVCAGTFGWAQSAAVLAGLVRDQGDLLPATWNVPPMPMLEPDREGLAKQRLVRNGVQTPSDVVREQGVDPEAHWEQYQADLEDLDRRGIVLDCDARNVTQSGQIQSSKVSTSKPRQ